MSDHLRVTRQQTTMTRVTPESVAPMTQEQKDVFLVNINDERIRENSILSTRMAELEGDITDQLKLITKTLINHGDTLSEILSFLQVFRSSSAVGGGASAATGAGSSATGVTKAAGSSSGVGGGALAATGAGSSATGAVRSSGTTSGGPTGLSGGTGSGLRLAPGAARSASSAKVVPSEQLSVKLFDNKKMHAWDGTDFVGWAPGSENLMMTCRVWGYFDGVHTWGSDPGEQYVFK